MTNCTVSGNTTSVGGSGGGGIFNAFNGKITMTNCTVSGNNAGFGGGIRNSGTLNLNNSIVANNSAPNGPDILGAVNSEDFNLIKNTSGISGTLPGSNNITGQDPKLAPLGDYGGPTQTQPLLLGSPAINAGNNFLAPPTDQRGFNRISDGTIDIGAVELQFFNVTNTNDSGSGSLRNTLSLSNQFADDNIVKINIPTSDPNCSSGACTVKLISGEIQVSNGAVLVTNPSGTNQVRISGESASRVFHVLIGAELRTENLSIMNGNDSVGGGFFNEGTLVLIRTTVRGNFVSGSGAGIYNNFGNLTLINSTVSANTAVGSGGGIYNFYGTVNLFNSTVSHNAVTNNGGGGVVSFFGTVNARNTIIANNSVSTINPDFSGTLTSQGNNLIGNTSGTSGTIASDITGQNLLLTPLGYYGGGTWTRALLTTSPALNAGNSCVTNLSCSSNNPPSAITTDQRGASRTDSGRGTAVDIGAYEVNTGYVANLPNGMQSSSYSFQISQYQTSEGTFNFSMTNLPSGLSLTQTTSGGVVTVQITGTPTQTGSFTPQLTITSGGQTATVNYSLFVMAPTAASVSISGRVFGVSGRGLRNAYVILTDDQGTSRTVQTSAFGYYRFEEVEVGRTYILTVRSKRYEFEPQVVFVTDEITELNFYPVEYRKGALDRFDLSLKER